MGSNNNYGKMWLICHRHTGVFFPDLLFLFSSFPSILFALFENSSLSLQTPVITNKSADSSPVETMIMTESSKRMCLCVSSSKRRWRWWVYRNVWRTVRINTIWAWSPTTESYGVSVCVCVYICWLCLDSNGPTHSCSLSLAFKWGKQTLGANGIQTEAVTTQTDRRKFEEQQQTQEQVALILGLKML